MAPGDPIEISFRNEAGHSNLTEITPEYYELRRKELGLDLPLFYFSLGSAAVSDTINKVAQTHHRKFLEKTAKLTGNWNNSIYIFQAIIQLEEQLKNISNSDLSKDLSNNISRILRWKNERNFMDLCSSIYSKSQNTSLHEIQKNGLILNQVATSAYYNRNSFKRFIPKLTWNGKYNQYHVWLFGNKYWPPANLEGRKIHEGAINGDFGNSYQQEKPVINIILQGLPITIGISLSAFLLFNFLGTLFGFVMSITKNQKTETGIKTFLSIIFSVPQYWLALLGIIFLCNPDYLNLFPSSFTGMESNISQNAITRISVYIYFLTLPILCIVLGNISFVGFQVYSETKNIIKSGYFLTARSKGLKKNKIFYNHILKNALLPIITFSSKSILMAITGSLTIEIIFSIDGIGTIIYEGLLSGDYPLIFTMTLIICSTTLLVFFIADIFYALADPRIKLS